MKMMMTHFIATVDDLTDVLDFDSKDIDGMDDDAGDEQEPRPTGHGRPLHHMMYTWWTHPKKTTTRNRGCSEGSFPREAVKAAA